MRFLQTEWHKHERDRNNWEIERAEMKARIAKLEGENRAEKRLHQVQLARIKILERALKKERSDRALGEGKSVEEISRGEKVLDDKEKVKGVEKTNNLTNSSALYRSEAGRSKNRTYLEKCLQEITYLLKPPSHPPPQQQSRMNIESLVHQQQQGQYPLFQQQPNVQQQLQHPSPSPSHQPPPPPQSNHELAQSHPMRSHSAQSLRGHQSLSFQGENRLQPQISLPSMSVRESAEKALAQLGALPPLKQEYGKKETNPFSAAAGIEVALGRRDTPSSITNVEDAWDFDEKIGESDTDSISSSNSLEDEPIEFSSLNHSGRANSLNSQRRKLSHGSKRRNQSGREHLGAPRPDSGNFKVKFALRGHLDVVRAVVFTGGGTPNEPEICTAGDDGVLKRWHIPGNYGLSMSGVMDVDVTSHFTHRGHSGIVTSLAASPGYNIDGISGGWVFSGGQDTTVKVWETGKVEPKATLIGHTDTVWAVCVLPSASAMSGAPEERILVASGSADGTIKIWGVTPPPAPPRRPSSAVSNSSIESLRGSRTGGFTDNDAFDYSLISTIKRPDSTASPTCIIPMSITGETFIVSYDDSNVIIYDTASGEQVVRMASQETYDGTSATGVSSVVATTMSLESGAEPGREEDVLVAGATGGQKNGVGGVVISGHEDQYVRIFDANSGQCTYTMLAHPAAISSLALSPDGRELVSAGHDASLRFWSMEKRACTQEITSHRLMRGEGVCAVVWSTDGKWVVSGGGDGVVKVYCR